MHIPPPPPFRDESDNDADESVDNDESGNIEEGEADNAVDEVMTEHEAQLMEEYSLYYMGDEYDNSI